MKAISAASCIAANAKLARDFTEGETVAGKVVAAIVDDAEVQCRAMRPAPQAASNTFANTRSLKWPLRESRSRP